MKNRGGLFTDYFFCGIAQHALCAFVEDTDQTFRIGGDNRKIRASKDRLMHGRNGPQLSLDALALSNIAHDSHEAAYTFFAHQLQVYLHRKIQTILAPVHCFNLQYIPLSRQ